MAVITPTKSEWYGGSIMQQQFNNNGQQQPMNNMQPATHFTGQTNHGAHEILDVHEVLSGFTSAFNEFLMCEQHIKDPELLGILQQQRQFMTTEYNILVEALQSGQETSQQTSVYKMNQSNEVQYGLAPAQPSKPNQQVSQLGDKCISTVMLTCAKSLSGVMTKAATECTNPVVRRVIADSVPNHIEMAYEIFLYQNKKGYYQVPQFTQQDMQQLLTAYAPSGGMNSMNQQGKVIQ
jgi:spore coat protein CotF